MKTVVCVKQVDGELNPFDACALECALQIENNDITVISMGREDVKETLLPLTRLGIKRAILLCDNAFAGADTLATAYTLSKVISEINPDLVLCGRQSVDGDTAQTGSCISGMLCYNIVTNVLSVDAISESGIDFTTRLGKEFAEFPMVATIERINTLRFPSIRSKAFPVEVLSAKDIGADLSKCGINGSPTRVLKTFESEIGRRKCKFIDKTEFATVLFESLQKQTEKEVYIKSDVRLETVHITDNSLAEIAGNIAENVVKINSVDPNEIVDIIHKEKAEIVLFPSTLFWRKTAPVIQAKLETGLCADCTRLETDGKSLYMYRPAFGGSLVAEIECNKKPALATVRTHGSTNSGCVISAGLGAIDYIENIKAYCNKCDYEFGASRALVDKAGLPYEYQVGLTGKAIAPKVYVACGISGAVHHTCAIEKAQTVIAINKDKNARIFDYADYGVVCDIKDIIGRI